MRWISIPRSSLAIPAVAAVGGAAFFAWKPGVALSMLGSPRAFGFAASVGILIVALGWLLPRVAVATPRQARWIVSRFADPGTAGVPVADVRKLAPNTFVARVRR